MLLLAKNPEDTLRFSFIKKNKFRLSCTNVRFLPGTATHALNGCLYAFSHVVFQSLIMSDFGKLTSMTVFDQSNELKC